MKHGGKGYMHEGMVNRSPPGHSGMKPPKGHVDHDTTRKETAPTPKTLGPRTA